MAVALRSFGLQGVGHSVGPLLWGPENLDPATVNFFVLASSEGPDLPKSFLFACQDFCEEAEDESTPMSKGQALKHLPGFRGVKKWRSRV